MKIKKLFIILLIPFILFVSSFKVLNKNSAYIVLEKTTNRILEGNNYDQQMLIASTAKILTAITVIENYDLNEKVYITKEDTLETGSKVYLKENELISRKDLLYALMLRSANDAASALSFNNSNEFITKMNETAKKIGMLNSVFANASGLDEREFNLSTAYDLAILSSYASNNELFVSIASAHSHRCETNQSEYLWNNKHKLVKNNDNFLWGKTGYTKKSGRILVSSYYKDNMHLFVVTINDGNDWNNHKKYIDQLEKYSFITVYKKGIYDSKLNVNYYIFVEDDIIIPLSRTEEENLKLHFRLFENYVLLDVYIQERLICRKQLEIYKKN